MLKKIALILLAVMSSAVILASCSQKKEEFVDVSTSLQFDNAFAGSRTITMIFPESTEYIMLFDFDSLISKYLLVASIILFSILLNFKSG